MPSGMLRAHTDNRAPTDKERLVAGVWEVFFNTFLLCHGCLAF